MEEYGGAKISSFNKWDWLVCTQISRFCLFSKDRFFNGDICSWDLQRLEPGQDDYSRHSREDRWWWGGEMFSDISSEIFFAKLFLAGGQSSWLVVMVLGWEQISLAGCSHTPTRWHSPVSTRQRRRRRVAAEVTSLEFMAVCLMVVVSNVWLCAVVTTAQPGLDWQPELAGLSWLPQPTPARPA